MGKIPKVILIIILGLGLRLIILNQSFWLDEASQAQQSQQSVQYLWSGRANDFQPPLFYLLAHYWMILNRSEIFLRLLPVGFGVATIILIYKLTNSLFANSKTSLLSALFLAINPYHIYYSQEFRPYSLLAMFGTWSVYLLNIQSNWLFLINALLLYTHYGSALLIVSEVIYILLFKRKNIKWIFVQLTLTLVIYIPWIPQFWLQFQSGVNIDTFLPGWREVLTLSWFKALPLIIFKFTAGRINIYPKIVYAFYIIFVFAVTSFALLLAKKQRAILWIWFFLPIVLSVLISFVIPLAQPFRLIFCLPALIIIFAQSANKYPKLMITLIVYISIFGNILYFTRVRLQREQWRQAISFLSSQQGDTLVKFSDKFAPFTWYNEKLPVKGVVKSYPATEDVVAKNLLSTNLSNRLFLLEYLTELTDPNYVIEKNLSQLEYQTVKEYNFEGVGIIKEYVKK